MCERFGNVARGGGQNKKEHTPRGRPAGESSTALVQHIARTAPTPFLSANISQLQYPSVPLNDQLSCTICGGILDRPVELTCGAIVCSPCCSKWVMERSMERLEISCPCCYSHRLDITSIRPPPLLVLSLLAGVLVYCERGCGKLVRLDNHDRHTAGSCHGHQVDSPSKMTLRDVLEKPVTVPATPAEVKVAGHLVRRMLDGDPQNQLVRVPTRGQVRCLEQIFPV